MGEPGVRVLGIVLCDQTLVGVVLQGGVGGAVGSLGGEFHYTVRLFVQPRDFRYRYTDQDGASKS